MARYLFWRGMMARDGMRVRLGALVVMAVLSVSIVFTQLSFVALGSPDTVEVYVMFLLAPVAVGALLLGTLGGTVLGLFAGGMLYVHSRVMPLVFQELTLVTPASSIVTYGTFGLLMGLLFAVLVPRAEARRLRHPSAIDVLVARGSQARKAIPRHFLMSYGRAIAIACVGAFLMRAVFGMVRATDTPAAEMVLWVLANTLVTTLPCAGIAVLVLWGRAVGSDIGVREMFRMTILFVVAFAFVVTSTISFVNVTLDEQHSAEAAIRSEVNYLCLQIESLTERAEAFERVTDAANIQYDARGPHSQEDWQLLSNPVGRVLNGYTMEQTGTVLLVTNGQVLMSDDRRIPTGKSIDVLGDDVVQAIEASVASGEVERIVYGGVLTSPGDTGGYAHDMQIGLLLAARQGDVIVVIIEPSSMVFRSRPSIIGREAFTVLITLVVVSLMVTRMLSVAVAGRIDQTNEALERITAGDLAVRAPVEGTLEFKSLSTGINQTVDYLGDLIAEVEKRMEEDLRTAHAIQEGALPRRFPAFPDIDVIDLYASMDAAKEVGGDFYDFFEVDDHTVAFLIADVSGKGIPGALFMMAAKAEIQNCLASGMGVAQAVGAANDYLCAHNEANMFVTVWAATLDWPTGLVTFVNAGHNFPLLRHGRGGSWEWLRQKSGLFLGMFEQVSYREHTLTLAPGDELVLYTDGVNEAFSVSEEEYGNARLEGFLAAHPDERPEALARDLRANVAGWAQGAEQSDDVTILVLEYDA